jgi:hypothetical protein
MVMARLRPVLIGALALGLTAFLSGAGTYAAFFSRTANDGDGVGNSFEAGTVAVHDDDAGSAMFSVSAMRPADAPRSSCITVTYDGSLDATARIYASIGPSGLEPYLNLTVEEGSSSSGFGDCTGFSPTSTVYTGTLAAFPTSAATGIVDPDGTWSPGEPHSYRFTVSVRSDPNGQGKDVGAVFTWQVSNL